MKPAKKSRVRSRERAPLATRRLTPRRPRSSRGSLIAGLCVGIRRGILAVVTGSVLLLAVGWPAVPVAAAKHPTPSKVACQYFTALFGPDAAAREKAVELAAPGSIAHVFAVHQAAYLKIERVATGSESPNGARCSASKIESGKVPEKAPKKSKNAPITFSTVPAQAGISTYEEFTTDANGQLVSFTVNGSSLDGRIIEGTAPAVEALGTSIRVVSAYQSTNGGDLYIILELTGSPDGARDMQPDFSTFYESASGRRTAVGDPSLSAQWVGPPALRKGQGPVYAFAKFPAQPLGGTLNMTVGSNEFNEGLQQAVQIPIG